MIPTKRLEQALTYLSESIEDHAKAKAKMYSLRDMEKTVLAFEYLEASGTVAERDAHARTSKSYEKWNKDYEKSVEDFQILENKRSLEEHVIDCWRTEQASMRAGNV